MIRPSSVRFVLKLTQQVSRRVRDKSPVLQPGPLCWRPPRRSRPPEQMGRDGKTTARAPLGRMSPQAAAEHLWARNGSGAFGFAREREASALTGDIARFWSKVREALDRLHAKTTTDGWSI
jgi:hypothetical protein